MNHIKCKYITYKCSCNGVKIAPCLYEKNLSACKYYEHESGGNCFFLSDPIEISFEEDVKSYEFIRWYGLPQYGIQQPSLKIGRKEIKGFIKYLEIDGKVLVNTEEEEDDG